MAQNTEEKKWFVRSTYYPEANDNEPLPDNVREVCDDPEVEHWGATRIDPTNIRAYRCVSCEDLLYTVQVDGDWADLDKSGEDRGTPDHVNDGDVYTHDPEHPGEWLCGWCREDFYDYPASTDYAVLGDDVTAILTAGECFTAHYNTTTFTWAERHALWKQLKAYEQGTDEVTFPSIEFHDVDEEWVYVEEGKSVLAFPDKTDCFTPNHYGVRDSFIERVLEGKIALHSPAIIDGSYLYVNEHALDFVQEQYKKFAKEYKERQDD